jgi:hypothetical protein
VLTALVEFSSGMVLSRMMKMHSAGREVVSKAAAAEHVASLRGRVECGRW